ncbi:hypothetical protein ACIQC9_06235 [Brevundimonas sp. NPDC092305]|uniref:hypothetical protein n=1 Tax=Brevundimonas sp. NPDC092305 TaxID=3363957 RepID=UPI00380194F7
MSLTDLCNDLTARGEVTDDDVLALRRAVFGEVTVTPDEVEALFRIDEGTEQRTPAWRAFFLEALTDWLVRQQEPAGYVTEAQADWLIARIETDRRVRDATELELVVRVLEQTDSAPASLAAFGLRLVTRSVVENDGVISSEEVERMRRLMFAPSGPGRLAISREEADALFDLNDATRGAANDPSWTDFFMRAVANAVTAAAGWAPPGREEALRRERWLANPEDGIWAGFWNRTGGMPKTANQARNRMLIALPGLLRQGLSPDEDVFAERLDSRTRAASTAAPVDALEARWLVDRIGRDGVFDDNERALISFLNELAPETDEALQPLIAKLAA